MHREKTFSGIEPENSENQENARERNYALILRTVQLHSGLTAENFSKKAKVSKDTLRIALKRKDILLKTAARLMAYNGYVFVFKIDLPNTPEAVLVESNTKDPFDVDWETYKFTGQLQNIFRLEPEFTEKACKALNVTDRAIRYNFQKDNGNIKRIYDLAEAAGLKIRMLVKYDPEAAEKLVKRLEADKSED